MIRKSPLPFLRVAIDPMVIRRCFRQAIWATTAITLLWPYDPARGQMHQSGPRDLPITAAHQADIIDSLARTLDLFYVFPDRAKEMGRLVKSNLKKGAYRDIVTLGDELSALVGRPVDLVFRWAVERSHNWIRRKAILGTARTLYAA